MCKDGDMETANAIGWGGKMVKIQGRKTGLKVNEKKK